VTRGEKAQRRTLGTVSQDSDMFHAASAYGRRKGTL
jgi:hypothetical protein